MLSGYRGELPEASLIVSRKLGSFDSAAASLREAAARLRMTGVSGVLSTTNKGDLTVAFHALAGQSARFAPSTAVFLARSQCQGQAYPRNERAWDSFPSAPLCLCGSSFLPDPRKSAARSLTPSTTMLPDTSHTARPSYLLSDTPVCFFAA